MISGPTIKAGGLSDCFMGEVVRLGASQLVGEVIRLERGIATIQVYENTTGLKVGEEVSQTGKLFSVELGPGLLGRIYDGIQRPLGELAEKWGDLIERGAEADGLSKKTLWRFTPVVKPGDKIEYGFTLGTVQESKNILHKIMTPQGVTGEVSHVEEGEFPVDHTVVTLTDGAKLDMRQSWNIRNPRPRAKRLSLTVPALTGQRVIDTLFPIAEGGVAIIPGGFGSGKTMLEQTIAKFALADVVVYIGCGERGNEMADTLEELASLKDPRTGRPLMERTALIANTSNMPVAAREASIYTGVTIAEYYRDMGYNVVVLADSTSRWAEALREISSRLEEIPGEEGYPPYLASRLGAFYERAGRVSIAGREEETGSITIIGAVSPPGGDFSEPVTQSSLRMASTFWGLDSELAYQRHFPAINWHSSYSLTYRSLLKWYEDNVSQDWDETVKKTGQILQREEELYEIVQVIGADALEEKERTSLLAAQLIREGFLRQSAVHPTDSHCSIKRQEKILTLILDYIAAVERAVEQGAQVDDIIESPVTERILRIKEISEEHIEAEIRDVTAVYTASLAELIES